MVEINNQRKAFLDMLAWSEELITDVKARNHGYDVIVGGELFADCSRSPSQTCHAKPKTQINRRGRYQLLSVGGMPTASSLAWKTSLRKVRTLWHCNRLRSVALYLWLIVVISNRQSTVAAISGFTAGRWLWSFEHKADNRSCKIQRSGRNGQRLMPWASHRDYLHLVICIIVCLSPAVNHLPRDNAITYKAQRDKMPELKSWRTQQYDMQMRQRDVAALDAKYTKS